MKVCIDNLVINLNLTLKQNIEDEERTDTNNQRVYECVK